MRGFCETIKKAVSKRFNKEIDVFVSRKKRFVHFAFPQPLMSYSFHKDLLYFVKREWKLREIFLKIKRLSFPV